MWGFNERVKYDNSRPCDTSNTHTRTQRGIKSDGEGEGGEPLW